MIEKYKLDNLQTSIQKHFQSEEKIRKPMVLLSRDIISNNADKRAQWSRKISTYDIMKLKVNLISSSAPVFTKNMNFSQSQCKRNQTEGNNKIISLLLQALNYCLKN